MFIIWFLKKTQLSHYVMESYKREPQWIEKIIWRYTLALVALPFILTAATIPTYVNYSGSFKHATYQYRLFTLLTTSAFVHHGIWAVSLVNLWLIHHLVAREWREYIQKLSKGGFRSTGEALMEHAALTEKLSKLNGHFEVFMFASLSLLLPLILSSLYVSLLPQYAGFSVWTISFIFDVLYVFAIVLPGSVVTTRTRRVLKITNRLRALMDPNDEKGIRQIDSFLTYLNTNNASSKVAGSFFCFFFYSFLWN
jgi:hypothetical protein